MVAKIGENFNVSEDDKVVENFYMENFVDINDWLKGVMPSPVIFFYDGRQFDEKDEKQKEGDPEVKMAFGTRSRLPPGSPTCSDCFFLCVGFEQRRRTPFGARSPTF